MKTVSACELHMRLCVAIQTFQSHWPWRCENMHADKGGWNSVQNCYTVYAHQYLGVAKIVQWNLVKRPPL